MWRAVGWAALLGGISLGCQATEDGESAGLDRQSFAGAFARAKCIAYQRCACSWGEIALCEYHGQCPNSLEECIQLVTADMELGLAHLDELAVEFVPEHGQACLDTLASSACDAIRLLPVCDRLSKPTLPLGAACTSPFECIGSETNQADCDGVCVARGWEGPHVPPGGACNATCEVAADATSYRCDTGGVVVDPSAELRCFVNDGVVCVGGVCAPPLAEGAQCRADMECTSGTFCSLSACTPLLAQGAECSRSTACVESAYCDTYSLSSRCVPRLADGAECTPTDRETCASDWCNASGVCAPLRTERVCDS